MRSFNVSALAHDTPLVPFARLRRFRGPVVVVAFLSQFTRTICHEVADYFDESHGAVDVPRSPKLDHESTFKNVIVGMDSGPKTKLRKTKLRTWLERVVVPRL